MKLNSIQFLRAFAAILVVYHHGLKHPMGETFSYQQNFYQLKNFGCIGVDLFFVISGFIITYVANAYLGASQSINFLAKRFLRINPIYYLVSFIYLGVILILKLVGGYEPYIPSLNKVVNSLVDMLLVLPTSGDILSFSPLLIVGWTLSFEWLFYLFFFSTVLLKIRQKAFWLVVVICLLVLLGQLLRPTDLRLLFLTNPIMLEFLLGVMLCWLYIRVKLVPTYVGASCLIIGIVCYGLLIRYDFGSVWHYKNILNGEQSIGRFWQLGIPSCLIVAGCVFLEKNKRFNQLWDNRYALLVGDASYSIYLIHPIFIFIFRLIFDRTGFFIPADAIILLEVLISIIISILFFKMVERPLLLKVRNIEKWNAVTTASHKKIIYE
jgi:exopolysaccharide production protein ExoZ